MGAGESVNAALTLRDIASIIGRNQGPELFFNQTFTALASPILPDSITLNRPLESINIMFRGRIIVAVAGFTPFPEALWNLLQRIRLTGTHRRFGALVPIDWTGGTAGRYLTLWRDNGSQAGVLAAGGQMIFGGSAGDIQSSTSTFTGAIGSHDVEVHWQIPLGPIIAPAMKPALPPFLYFKDDWQDTLRLQLFFGDGTSLGGVAANVTFEQFGGGGGTSPSVEVHTNYELLGPVESSVAPAVVIRSENPVTAVVTGVSNLVRLVELQKQKTTAVVMKSGTIPAGLSPGIQVFGTLVDTILSRTQIIADNKPLRNNQSNQVSKAYMARVFDTVPQNGYLPFSFVDSQNPLTYFRGDLLSGGSNFKVQSDVATAGATQVVNLMQEQVIGDPGGV